MTIQQLLLIRVPRWFPHSFLKPSLLRAQRAFSAQPSLAHGDVSLHPLQGGFPWHYPHFALTWERERGGEA